FALVAVVARPVGGILSDRIGPVRVCLISFVGTTLMAGALGFEPPTELPAGTVFVLMAGFLGLGTGGAVALVAPLGGPARAGRVLPTVDHGGGPPDHEHLRLRFRSVGRGRSGGGGVHRCGLPEPGGRPHGARHGLSVLPGFLPVLLPSEYVFVPWAPDRRRT